MLEKYDVIHFYFIYYFKSQTKLITREIINSFLINSNQGIETFVRMSFRKTLSDFSNHLNPFLFLAICLFSLLPFHEKKLDASINSDFLAGNGNKQSQYPQKRQNRSWEIKAPWRRLHSRESRMEFSREFLLELTRSRSNEFKQTLEQPLEIGFERVASQKRQIKCALKQSRANHRRI